MDIPELPNRPAGWPEAVKRLDQFDQAWLQAPAGTAPRIDAFLPPGPATPDPLRRKLLEELIKIDLEQRWRSRPGGGNPPILDDYVAQFPELGPPSSVSLDLIAWEYRVRREWGDRPDLASYPNRFPAHGPKLREALQQVDAELDLERAEDGTPRPAVAPNPSITSPGELTAILTQLPVLAPAQMDDLKRMHGGFTDARSFGKELLQRGWITAYQLNQLFVGRGPELLVGSYLLLERLGEGGAGQVFKVRHRQTGQLLALKLIRKELLAAPEVVARFQRETQLVRQFDHPNIVRAVEAGPIPSPSPLGGEGGVRGHFLAMEFVEGPDLGRMVKQGGPLPAAQACEYMRQAALALQYAHERGVVHRDIKPHNFIVSGRDGLVKLTDLGLARPQRAVNEDPAGTDGTGTLTPENAAMIGTMDYMAPEQALDFHQADIRSDIYGLGCTFYYLLTGRPPFPGGTLAQKVLKHQQAEPQPVEQFRSDVPPAILALLRRMMAKRPEKRPQTPFEVATFLAAAPAEIARAISSDARRGFFARHGRRLVQWLRLSLRTHPRVRWGLIGAVAVGLLVLLWIIVDPLDRRLTPAARALKSVQAEAKNPKDIDATRSAILKLRADFSGTPEARQAGLLFTQLPSPLDQLKPEEIPADVTGPGQLRQVVAVFGKKGQRQVRCMAFSPDCKWFVYAGDDQTIHLVDTRTRTERELKGHSASIHAVAFAPDGRTFASASSDGIVKFWEPATGNDLGKPWTPRGEGSPRLAFSPDGSTLLWTHGNKLHFWDWTATPPQVKTTLVSGGYSIADVAFSPDGASVIVADNSPAIQVRDIATGAARATYPLPKGSAVYSVAVAPDGQSVAAACRECLHVWDIDGTERRWAIRKPIGGALSWSVNYAPSGRLISANMTSIEVISSAGQTVDAWKTPWQFSFGVLAPDGRHLAISSGAGIVIFRLTAK